MLMILGVDCACMRCCENRVRSAALCVGAVDFEIAEGFGFGVENHAERTVAAVAHEERLFLPDDLIRWWHDCVDVDFVDAFVDDADVLVDIFAQRTDAATVTVLHGSKLAEIFVRQTDVRW